jgi:hypothetical protein
LEKIKQIIQKEINEYFKKNIYSEEIELNLINEILLGELLDPNNSYPYSSPIKGLWMYKDINNVDFFVRITYQPTQDPHFEFKTGWFDKNNKAIYEPSIPPNSSSIDWDKRSNTVAKIYKDEILPFFEKQNISNILIIKPISDSRMKFAERLVKKFTPLDKFDIEYNLFSQIVIKNK